MQEEKLSCVRRAREEQEECEGSDRDGASLARVVPTTSTDNPLPCLTLTHFTGQKHIGAGQEEQCNNNSQQSIPYCTLALMSMCFSRNLMYSASMVSRGPFTKSFELISLLLPLAPLFQRSLATKPFGDPKAPSSWVAGKPSLKSKCGSQPASQDLVEARRSRYVTLYLSAGHRAVRCGVARCGIFMQRDKE